MKWFLALFSFSILCLGCESLGILLSGDRPANFEIEDNVATLNGVLGKAGYVRFQKLFKKHPEIDTIVFMNTPGSQNDDFNIKTALLLHEKAVTVMATSESEIASGAVDLFLAGQRRIVEQGALFGVHSWGSGNDEGITIDHNSDEHNLFLDYYRAIDIDTSFYWFTLKAAPFDSIHWMTEEEITRYKITNP